MWLTSYLICDCPNLSLVYPAPRWTTHLSLSKEWTASSLKRPTTSWCPLRPLLEAFQGPGLASWPSPANAQRPIACPALGFITWGVTALNHLRDMYTHKHTHAIGHAEAHKYICQYWYCKHNPPFRPKPSLLLFVSMMLQSHVTNPLSSDWALMLMPKIQAGIACGYLYGLNNLLSPMCS